jgi:hypothetical protein
VTRLGLEPRTYGLKVVVSLQNEQPLSDDNNATCDNDSDGPKTEVHGKAQALAHWIADCPIPCGVDEALAKLLDKASQQ